MEQVLNAIAYLHSKGVIHGDIKLENIMLYTTTKSARERFTMINKQLSYDPSLQMEIENSYREGSESKREASSKSTIVVNNMLNYEIKLIDFGCSKLFTKHGERKSGIIGTSIYCSPEVIDDLYDEKCDEWSCGILMYLLLCGEPPFDGETDKEIFEKIKKGKYSFSLPHFKNVSNNCKDLIKKLLEPKISRRIKAKDALKHPFFTESFNPEEALTQNKDITIIKRLETLKLIQSQFHQAIISYMSSNYISKDEEKKLRTVFRYIDYDNKSFLTKAKIEKVLKEYGILCTEEKLQRILEVLDVDKDGVVEYQEFIQGLCDKCTLFNEFNLKNVFAIMDEDNKGYLTSDDIKNFAFPNKTVNKEAITEYLNQFGMKIDDKLKFDSFVYIIQNNCSLNDKDNINNININEILNSKNINEGNKKEKKFFKKYSSCAYSSENDDLSCYSELSDKENDEKEESK
jgi:calcium-dependent protein kinase